MSAENDDIKLTDAQKTLGHKAAQLYSKGKYAEALVHFETLSKQSEDLAFALSYCIRFCRNVISTELSGVDKLYELSKKITKPLWIVGVLLGLQAATTLYKTYDEDNFFVSITKAIVSDWSVIIACAFAFGTLGIIYKHCPTGHKLQCKYCGHYTDYISPDEGVAYLDMNNCKICGRSYPMPSSRWDSHWGQTYIYERGSVTENVFYEEFEAANPNYPRSEMADRKLRGKKRPR